jgi:uncharacterized protein (TIGR04255 family)
MPFPATQRVIYSRTPLDRVICQLRFPPILRIDAAVPAEFQESIRGEFPNFKELSEVKIELPVGFAREVPTELFSRVAQASATKNYEFTSGDGYWQVNLTRTFLSLTTTKYLRWENFRERLQLPFDSLINCYAPSYFSRLGVRYINVIKPSALGLGAVPWSELLSPNLIGMLNSEETSASVTRFESIQMIRLADQGGMARILSRLLEAGTDGESRFMLDNDLFYDSRTEVDGVFERLKFLNLRSARLLRWSIADRLHQAMGPEPL